MARRRPRWHASLISTGRHFTNTSAHNTLESGSTRPVLALRYQRQGGCFCPETLRCAPRPYLFLTHPATHPHHG